MTVFKWFETDGLIS